MAQAGIAGSLRQIQPQAITQLHQARMRLTAKQAHQQLGHYDQQQQGCSHLPHGKKQQHPQYAQDQRLATQAFDSWVHTSPVNPRAGIKSTSVLGSPPISPPITRAGAKPSKMTACRPHTSGI